MERAEKVGLGVAAIGHVLLFGILSLGLVTRAKLPPPRNDPIDVVLVDAIGARSAAPQAEKAPPAPSEAPAVAKPEEAVAPTPAPPEPAPAPEPAPVPKPLPPKPAKPAPPRPEPKPEPKAVPKPVVKPKPAPPKPEPKPEPKPTPKPTPKPAKPAPEKSAPAKAEPAKAAEKPAKATKADIAATGDTRDRRRPDRATEGGGAPSTKAAKPAGGKPGDKPAKATGSRLGPDFLKGITPEKTAGKATKPAAATVSAVAMQGLGAAIQRQVQPCYDLGALQGTPAMSIVTTLRMKMNKDGSVASVSVLEQSGVNGGNQSYARQMGELSVRAVKRCAPLKLPAELYEGGWEDIAPTFTPGRMG